jgi:hypothetical protein
MEKEDRVYVKSENEEGVYKGESEEPDKVLVDIDEEHLHRGLFKVEKELVEKIED